MRVRYVTVDPAKEGSRVVKKIVLSQSQNEHAKALLVEMARIVDLGVKIFRTTVYRPNDGSVQAAYDGPMSERFITGSREIHLRLGEMTEAAQWSLASLVQETVGQSGNSLLIFTDDKNLIATVSKTGNPGVSGEIHLNQVR